MSVGLTFNRFFTRAGTHPFDELEWEKRHVVIPDEKTGQVAFEYENIEVPNSWSQLSTGVMAHKYLRKAGIPGTGAEKSAKQLIFRIAHTIRVEGNQMGYFATDEDAEIFEMELTHILIAQKGAFNSPVLFNCGLSAVYGTEGGPGNWWLDNEKGEAAEQKDSYLHPQNSACFIQSVDDDLMSIFELVKNEAISFLGTLAFIGLGIYGLVETWRIVSHAFFAGG